jgi:hypothetical protein
LLRLPFAFVLVARRVNQDSRNWQLASVCRAPALHPCRCTGLDRSKCPLGCRLWPPRNRPHLACDQSPLFSTICARASPERVLDDAAVHCHEPPHYLRVGRRFRGPGWDRCDGGVFAECTRLDRCHRVDPSATRRGRIYHLVPCQAASKQQQVQPFMSRICPECVGGSAQLRIQPDNRRKYPNGM